MRFFLSIITLLILGSCSREPKESGSKRPSTDTATVSDRQPDNDSVNKTQLNNRSSAQADRWAYEKTGGAVVRASVNSSNLIQFEYPYTGGSTATLTIREKDGSTQAYIDVSNGQFNRSFQNGTARIRFDGKPPVTYPLLAAANGRANIIFFDAEQRLINQIKASKKMSVNVIFDGQPIRRIEFRTANLRWKQ